MNFKLIKLLAVACSILVVVIVVEWQYARFSKKQLFKKLVAEIEQGYAAGELPQIDLAHQAEESFVDMTSRPLFIEGRRPVPESENEAEQSVVPIEKFDLQLEGVYIHQDVAMALFGRTQQTANMESHLKKSEGEEIDGWTLLEIASDKVVLEQGSKRHELMLRKPKPTKLPSHSRLAPHSATPTKTQHPILNKNTQ